MREIIKNKYFLFLENFQVILYSINTYSFFFYFLWIIQFILIICLLLKVTLAYKIILCFFLQLIVIHFSISIFEIINDYIFNNFLKRIFALFVLIITYSFII